MFPGLDLFSTYTDPAGNIMTAAIGPVVDYLDRDLSDFLKINTNETLPHRPHEAARAVVVCVIVRHARSAG